MQKMEFFNDKIDLETLSDLITGILHNDGYNKIVLDTSSNPKDDEDRIFRIEAYKTGVMGNSRTKHPPIKFQIRGKSNHFIIAQQWNPEDFETFNSIILGLPGVGMGVIRGIQRNRLQKSIGNY